jgi:hypothetical protein
MPGDPNECRTHALECTNLAETALNKNARETFLYFASAWFKLASCDPYGRVSSRRYQTLIPVAAREAAEKHPAMQLPLKLGCVASAKRSPRRRRKAASSVSEEFKLVTPRRPLSLTYRMLLAQARESGPRL